MKTSKFIFAFIASLFVMCSFKASALNYKMTGNVGQYKIHANIYINDNLSITGNYYYDWTRAKGSKSTFRLSGSYGKDVAYGQVCPSGNATIFEYDSKGNVIGRFDVYVLGLSMFGTLSVSFEGTYTNLKDQKTYKVDWVWTSE